MKQPKILLVEDDPDFRRFMRVALKTSEFKVLEAGDVDSALKILSGTSVDLVITDMCMPGKSGIDLLGEVKDRWPYIPVIIVTGMPQIESAVECIKIGAFDYVSKPFDLGEFSKTVDKALDCARTNTSKSGEETEISYNTRTLAGYTILKTIGEGSMGIVFLAEKQDENGNPVEYALKIVKASLSEQRNQKLMARFFNEIEAVSALNHANIVKVFEHGYAEEERIPYLVMEYVKGKSLREYCLESCSLDINQRLSIIRQIASALAQAHKNGIYHRDVKPDNVLVDNNSKAHLMDFGIAHIPDSDLTITQQTMGTPAYLSPEAINGSKVDQRADIYSLGSLSYELLVGRKPFAGETFFQIASMIQNVHPESPQKINPDFPELLSGILARMLKKDPADRYQTVDELIGDLDRYLYSTTTQNLSAGQVTLNSTEAEWA